LTLPFDTPSDPPLRLIAAYYTAFPEQAPEWYLETPGRDMWIAAKLTADDVVTVAAGDLDSRASFTWRSAKTKRTVTNRPLPRWARFLAGLVLALTDLGMRVPGMEAVIVGDELAGPRYEHALGMAFAALVYRLQARDVTINQLVDLVDRVRREYVDG